MTELETCPLDLRALKGGGEIPNCGTENGFVD